VAAHHLAPAPRLACPRAALRSTSFSCRTAKSTSPGDVADIITRLLELRAERSTCWSPSEAALSADLAGFAAAIYQAECRSAGADDAAGAGRFVGGRKTGIKSRARQEHDRRILQRAPC